MKVSTNVVRKPKSNMLAGHIESVIPMLTKYYTTKVPDISHRSTRLHPINLRLCSRKFPSHFCQRLTLRLLIWSAYPWRETSWGPLQIGALTESGSFKRKKLERVYENRFGVVRYQLGSIRRSNYVWMVEVYNWADKDIGAGKNNNSRVHRSLEESLRLLDPTKTKRQNLPIWTLVRISQKKTITVSQ